MPRLLLCLTDKWNKLACKCMRAVLLWFLIFLSCPSKKKMKKWKMILQHNKKIEKLEKKRKLKSYEICFLNVEK